MKDNRYSYLVNVLSDNYKEPLLLFIRNNFNTSTNQNNEKRHLLPESTSNVRPNLNNKTPVKSK